MATKKESMPTLALRLECMSESIRGETPLVLRLTIENIGSADERILQPRGDLQDTWYDLVVTEDGIPFPLPRAISDPGPITEEDFLTLKPGQAATFEFSRYALGVHYLPAGEYQARIRFWQNPFHPHTSAVLSPAADFVVEL